MIRRLLNALGFTVGALDTTPAECDARMAAAIFARTALESVTFKRTHKSVLEVRGVYAGRAIRVYIVHPLAEYMPEGAPVVFSSELVINAIQREIEA